VQADYFPTLRKRREGWGTQAWFTSNVGKILR
jgi:hypothetical protein